MTKQEHDMIVKMIKNTYILFKEKEKLNKTKSATINDIVKMIKKEVKENVNS